MDNLLGLTDQRTKSLATIKQNIEAVKANVSQALQGNLQQANLDTESDHAVAFIEFVRKNGEIKVFENVINVSVGELYDSETAKKVVGKSLPKNPRNFKNFRKMVFKSYIPKVKKNLATNHQIIKRDERTLTTDKNKLEILQKKIEESEKKIQHEKNKMKKMKKFLDTAVNM